MNNRLSTYDFNSNTIRVVEIDGEPWFVASDVCKTLGLYVNSYGKANVSVMMRNIDADEIGTYSVPTNSRGGGTRTQAVKTVSESGLYKITLRSNKPEARAFQDWVTRVVLPAIRKDGGYVMGEEKVVTGEMSEDELMARAVLMAQAKITRLSAEVVQLRQKLEHLTVQAYAALNGVYLSHGDLVKLGKGSQKLCRERGIAIETEERRVRKPYGGYAMRLVGKYPRAVLDEVATTRLILRPKPTV